MKLGPQIDININYNMHTNLWCAYAPVMVHWLWLNQIWTQYITRLKFLGKLSFTWNIYDIIMKLGPQIDININYNMHTKFWCAYAPVMVHWLDLIRFELNTYTRLKFLGKLSFTWNIYDIIMKLGPQIDININYNMHTNFWCAYAPVMVHWLWLNQIWTQYITRLKFLGKLSFTWSIYDIIMKLGPQIDININYNMHTNLWCAYAPVMVHWLWLI